MERENPRKDYGEEHGRDGEIGLHQLSLGSHSAERAMVKVQDAEKTTRTYFDAKGRVPSCTTIGEAVWTSCVTTGVCRPLPSRTAMSLSRKNRLWSSLSGPRVSPH